MRHSRVITCILPFIRGRVVQPMPGYSRTVIDWEVAGGRAQVTSNEERPPGGTVHEPRPNPPGKCPDDPRPLPIGLEVGPPAQPGDLPAAIAGQAGLPRACLPTGENRPEPAAVGGRRGPPGGIGP